MKVKESHTDLVWFLLVLSPGEWLYQGDVAPPGPSWSPLSGVTAFFSLPTGLFFFCASYSSCSTIHNFCYQVLVFPSLGFLTGLKHRGDTLLLSVGLESWTPNQQLGNKTWETLLGLEEMTNFKPHCAFNAKWASLLPTLGIATGETKVLFFLF